MIGPNNEKLLRWQKQIESKIGILGTTLENSKLSKPFPAKNKFPFFAKIEFRAPCFKVKRGHML